jgi:hypothetical protein
MGTPYTAADLALLKFSQSKDTLTVTHPSYAPRQITRTQHWVWLITTITYAASVTPPADVSAVPYDSTMGGATRYKYVVTTIGPNAVTESLPSALVGPITGTTITAGGSGYTSAPTVTFTPPPSGTTATGTAVLTGDAVTSITVTDPGSGYTSPPVISFAGGAGSGAAAVAHSPGIVSAQPLSTTSGARVRIEWLNVPGATRYNIYRTPENIDGFPPPTSLFGYIGSVEALDGATISFIDNNIAPDFTLTPPQANNPFAGSNNPFTSTYYDGRQVFGGFVNDPDGLAMSQSADFLNMDYSSPSRDNDSIEITLASNQSNPIKHLVPVNALIVLTGSGAWRVDGGTRADVITPTSILARPQAYNGCSDVPPLVINYDILYVQDKGATVRDLAYHLQTDVFTGIDVSLLGSHLFRGHRITEWCWAEEPHKLVWALRDDGLALTMTFLKDQEVYAWTRHDTDGLFKSTCSVSEGNENAVYFVCQRLINGQYVQYVERLATRLLDSDPTIGVPADLDRAWFVDAGLAFPRTTPFATLVAGALSGTAVPLTASSAVFNPATDVGKVVRLHRGIATVTAVTSTSSVVVNVTKPFRSLWPAAAGAWSIDTPLTVIGGLGHLEGKTVTGLADGSVIPPTVVTNGQITLQQAASAGVVGLGYQGQLKTLYLDVGEPTIQGRRKKLPAITLRVVDTRGLKAGPTFAMLQEIKERGLQPMGDPIQPITGDERVTMDPKWQDEGQVCVQQDYPLPATVLSFIPDVTIGDN